MSTPSDVLHAALCARPLQTASELTLSVASSDQEALTTAEVERLLVSDPRLRADTSTPPRWRALGAGHPATLLKLPTPRRRAQQVIAPAASFGERTGSAVVELPDPSGGILPAAAFAGRPSVRLQEESPSVPVRVPVSERLAAVSKPTVEAPAEPSVEPSIAAHARPPIDPGPLEVVLAALSGTTVAAPAAPTSEPTVAVPAGPTVAAPLWPTVEPTVATPVAPVKQAVPVAPREATPAAPVAPAEPTASTPVWPTVVAPVAPVEATHAAPVAPAEPTVAAPSERIVAPTVAAPAERIVAPTVAASVARTLAAPAAPTLAAPAAPTLAAPAAAPIEALIEAPVAAPVEAPAEPVSATPTNPTARVAEALPVRVAAEDRPHPEPIAATAPGGLFRALAATAVVERGPLPPGGDVRYVGPQLRRWQKDVLDAWLAEERRGIVEAVSAPGRVIVGVLAAWDALTRGEKVLVLVPTTDLLEQWFSTLELHLPGLSIGRRDITTAHTFDECDVLVSLVSAAFGRQLLEDGRAGLVIADEVHKYGSARPAETLRDGFRARLGLTSAMERQDAGFDEVLRPYFGAVLDGCDLRRGRKDGVLAPFRLAYLAVDLDADEQAEHDALSAQITDLAGRLTDHGCSPHRFADDVIRLQGGWRENSRAAADASAYLRAVSTRRDLLATSPAKTGALATLAPTLARSAHALVFAHTKDGADAAAAGLRAAGVSAAWLHNGLEPEVRRNTLRDLRTDRLKAITTPKVLDEGLDLPAVDVVVVLAASRTYRQLVQRASAVLSPTEADRLPVVLVVHARGTVDTDDGFVADLAAVATEVRTFDVGTSGAALAAWFLGV